MYTTEVTVKKRNLVLKCYTAILIQYIYFLITTHVLQLPLVTARVQLLQPGLAQHQKM